MRGSVFRAFLLITAAVSLGGCMKDEQMMCTIYQTFGEAKIPIETVEVDSREECNALLEEHRQGR